MSNVTCYESGCTTIGSLGNNAVDYVDNVLFEDIRCIHSSNAAWIKTYPTGQGHVRNVTFRRYEIQDVNQPIYLSACIYSYANCDASRLAIDGVRWEDIAGTSRYNVAAALHCSAAAPCTNLSFSGIDITPLGGGGQEKFLCANIQNQVTSGLQCTGNCPGSQPQQLSGNQ